MTRRGFTEPVLDAVDAERLAARAHELRGAVLTMTSAAGSGHPGGSMSSMELYLVLYGFASIRPEEPLWPERDRIIVSHGHTTPGVYAVLADNGFFDLDDLVDHFRQAGSIFEGHVERSVPGTEWSTGNLGQGLSAGVGSALAARTTGMGWRTFVTMSDAEQMKGQVGEARRLAARQGLCDLTVLVDYNGAQISGHTSDVMPVDVAAGFAADGWGVIEVDGHDASAVYAAVVQALADRQRPVAVLCRTVIGKGVSFMEDEPEFHGRGLTPDEYARAMDELDLDAGRLKKALERRSGPMRTYPITHQPPMLAVEPGEARTYTREKTTDCRSAWGSALLDVVEVNPDVPTLVFDCDLAASVKTEAFWRAHPEAFVECGVGEHNAAAASASASANGVLAIWADFGVFGCDEVYNQQRLASINDANLKLVLTHCGLDVGEDGKTHQCIDYVAAFRNMFGWKVIVPADPNQTDRAVRAALGMPGLVALTMGRSKLPVVLDDGGRPVFGGDYRFRYGAIDEIRRGEDASVLVMGTLSGAAVDAADMLRAEGMSVGVAVVSCPLDLDGEALTAIVDDAPLLVTIEDHSIRTGLGASIAEWLAVSGRPVRFHRLGVDRYHSSGSAKDLFARAGLDAAGIAETLRRLV